jgi:hypothetical protein
MNGWKPDDSPPEQPPHTMGPECVYGTTLDPVPMTCPGCRWWVDKDEEATMKENEAAERLHHLVITEAGEIRSEAVGKIIREALAAERRATVERIRERLTIVEFSDGDGYIVDDTQAILDDEATR